MEMMNEQSETACFDVDGVRYRYLYMKEDDPARGRRRTPVLFVHGFAQSALSWFPQAAPSSLSATCTASTLSAMAGRRSRFIRRRTACSPWARRSLPLSS